MPRFFRFWFTLTVLCLSLGSTTAFSASPAQKNILVLSSEDLSAPFFNKLFVSFRSAVKTSLDERAIVHAENLDFVQFRGPAYERRLHDWMRDKYRDKTIDAIVVVGYGALKFVVEARPRLWGDVPVIFVATTRNSVQKLSLTPRETGILSEVRLDGMVHLVKSVLPGTRQLVLVGNTPDRDEYRPFFAAELEALSNEIEFIDLRGRPFEEVSAHVADLPSNAAIYYTRMTDDGTGRIFVPADVLESLLKTAKRPTFVDNATFIGAGPVAALAADPALRGHQAAGYVLKILAGNKPSELPIVTGTAGPIFDWRQLKQWDIDSSSLPPDSDIRFYQPGVWEQYRWQIIATFLLIDLQWVLVAALLVERRRRARAVSESRQRLAEIAHMNRNATATVYSAAITHELNQPLAAIMSNTDAAEMFLKMDPPAIDDVQEILADIRRDNLRASDLIHRMRSLLKKSESDIQEVDVNALIQDVVKFLVGEAKMRQVHLLQQLLPASLVVSADKVQLQQVIVNLLLNSMDAVAEMPPAKRLITIRTALPDANHVEVVVTDSGIGFQSNIEQVFESFFTTKSEGMGLGLTITAAIVSAHGGQIVAQNAPEGGAIVRFKLPLQESTTR